MKAYSVKYEVFGTTRETTIDARDIKLVKNKLKRKHNKTVKIIDYRVIGCF